MHYPFLTEPLLGKIPAPRQESSSRSLLSGWQRKWPSVFVFASGPCQRRVSLTTDRPAAPSGPLSSATPGPFHRYSKVLPFSQAVQPQLLSSYYQPHTLIEKVEVNRQILLYLPTSTSVNPSTNIPVLDSSSWSRPTLPCCINPISSGIPFHRLFQCFLKPGYTSGSSWELKSIL